jgi:hypothetical protein
MEAKRPEPPEPVDVMRAVETYVRLAYDKELPIAVRSQLAVLESWKGPFFRSPAIAADRGEPPRRYSIRLGNRNYPHMKLAMELSPDGQMYLFKADTHDGHCLPPPEHPEYPAFKVVMEDNQLIAQAIEAAWAAQGLVTFKTYLRDDLARRAAAARDRGAE